MTDEDDGSRTGQEHACRMTGRNDGLIGKYDIHLCRQAFREVARDIGFRKYE